MLQIALSDLELVIHLVVVEIVCLEILSQVNLLMNKQEFLLNIK